MKNLLGVLTVIRSKFKKTSNWANPRFSQSKNGINQSYHLWTVKLLPYSQKDRTQHFCWDQQTCQKDGHCAQQIFEFLFKLISTFNAALPYLEYSNTKKMQKNTKKIIKTKKINKQKSFVIIVMSLPWKIWSFIKSHKKIGFIFCVRRENGLIKNPLFPPKSFISKQRPQILLQHFFPHSFLLISRYYK